MSKRIFPKQHKQIRPDIGEPFADMLFQLRDLVNSDLMNNWDYTVATRSVIAKAWRRAFPDRKLPKDAAGMLKPYYKDLLLNPDDVQSG